MSRTIIRSFSCGLLAALAVLCSLFSSSSANALSPSATGNVTINSGTVVTHLGNKVLNLNGQYQASWGDSLGGATYHIRDIYLRFNKPVPANSVLLVNITFEPLDYTAFFDQLNPIATGNSAWSLIDSECSNGRTNADGTVVSCNLWYYTKVADSQINLSPDSSPSNSALLMTVKGKFNIRVTTGTYFQTSDAEALSVIKNIEALLKNANFKVSVDNSDVIGAINQGNDQAHKDSQAQIDAIDKQTEQEKNQYDQEKQEEQDRENNLDNSSQTVGGLFNFNLINPLSGIFGLFSDGSSCASIPTIASWVHSDTSTYCPWFSPNVRQVLTPVFGLSSTMILLYFVIRWSLRLTETT